MTKDNVVDIKTKSNKAQKSVGKKNANALEFQLLNMRQLYEGCVQEKQHQEAVIGELRTILGSMIVSTGEEEFTIAQEDLENLQATYSGFEMVPDEDKLTIFLLRDEEDE